MPLPLHRVPSALLDIMRLRQFGRAPDEFGTTVVPVMEVGDCYAAPTFLTSGGTLIPGGLSPNLTATLDLSVDLRVRGICARGAIGAAAATNLAVMVGVILPGSATTECILATEFYPSIVAGAIFGCAVMGPPTTFRAGSRFFARATGTAAGVDHAIAANLIIENWVSG